MRAATLNAMLKWRFCKPLLVAAFLGQGLSACVTNGGTQGKRGGAIGLSGKSRVDSIRLFTSPSALNFDNNPGGDGFSAKVYAIENGKAKPVKITEGSLEFALFETVADGEPLQVWKYDASVLMRHMSSTQIGVAYNFQMRWNQVNAPKKKAAIVALYRAPEDRVVRAVPVVLSLGP